MTNRPTTPTGPTPRRGDKLRILAETANALAEAKNVTNAQRQIRLNQASKLRKEAAAQNTIETATKVSSAASISDYEKKLRAKATAHGSRTGMAKVTDAEIKKWEQDTLSELRTATPPTASNAKRIGDGAF